MKKCNVCMINKELKFFYSRKKRDDSLYYHPECKECSKNRSIQWRIDNRQSWLDSNKRSNSKVKKRVKMDIARKHYREEGKSKLYYHSHKDKFKVYRDTRKEKTHEISQQEWVECKNFFGYSCAYCDMSEVDHLDSYGEQLHKDHVDPSGSNKIDNCIPACKSCNSSKSDNLLEEWYNPNNHRFYKDRMKKIHIWLSQHKIFN